MDDYITLQEIIEIVHEFNFFCDEHDLWGDYEYEAVNMNQGYSSTKERKTKHDSNEVLTYDYCKNANITFIRCNQSYV